MRDRGLSGGAIGPLVGVLVDVVQLGPRRGDVFPRTRPERAQRRPAEFNDRRERFCVQLPVRQRGAAERRREIDAVGVLHLSADRVHDGRRHVDERHRIGDAHPAPRPSAAAQCGRKIKNQRHTQCGVVHEDAVRELAVLAECLAVIAGGNDQRVVRRGAERFHQAAELAIGCRDLIVVPIDHRTSCVRPAVGRVRLEQVDPEKERPGGRSGSVGWETRGVEAKPRDGVIDHLRCGPLVGRAAVGLVAQAIAVDVEAAIQTELMIERERGDEGGRAEAARTKLGGERGHGGRDADAVVARAVAGRIPAGQDRRVRRQRDRCGGVRAVEHHALAGERVERRRPRARPSVRADMVRSQRVDRDQNHVLRHWLP